METERSGIDMGGHFQVKVTGLVEILKMMGKKIRANTIVISGLHKPMGAELSSGTERKDTEQKRRGDDELNFLYVVFTLPVIFTTEVKQRGGCVSPQVTGGPRF